jgi:septum formation protein
LQSFIILNENQIKMPNSTSKTIFLPPVILASGSPRRAEILTSVGWPFRVIVPDVDESVRPDESASNYVERLAIEKARAVQQKDDSLPVLAADTTVVIDGSIIGKPADYQQAREMIKELSGRWHEVLTGVAITFNDVLRSGTQLTRVKFAKLSDKEIDFLSHAGNPLDKAGAYAVQGEAALFIEAIDGDYWNVVGLPISLVYSMFLSHTNNAEIV